METSARPAIVGDAGAPWAVASPAAGAWSPGAYARTFTFDASEPDVVRTTSTSVWGGESWAPTVPVSFGTVDALGHVTAVDGVTRGRDAQGNTTSLRSGSNALTVAHDSLARPTQVMRADGVGVRYTYRADGTRATREYVCPTPVPVGVTCSARTEALVYRGLQLLEVHEVSPSPRVRARYYYEDDGDVPYAADLWQPATAALARFVLLTDRQGSVVGVVDGTGAWIERVRYDLWGAPTVEAADTTAPALARIEVDSGELVLVASEAVLPAPAEASSGGDEVVTALRALSDVLRVVVPGTPDAPVAGTWRLVERGGAARGRELRFVPSGAMNEGQTLALEVDADGLWDGWSNAMASTRVAFTWGSGVRWAGSSAWTGSPVLTESAVGNELLFQSHTYEWALRLYHMRARLMDPGTGLFLEVDPEGYGDAANMYVLMANDPVNHRDPTGASVLTKAVKAARKLKSAAGSRINLLSSRAKKISDAIAARKFRPSKGPLKNASGKLDDTARTARTFNPHAPGPSAREGKALDTNTLIGSLEEGQLPVLDAALGTARPVVPFRTAKEFLRTVDGPARTRRAAFLRGFLQARGGRVDINNVANGAERAALKARVEATGRVFDDPDDLSIGASAAKAGLELLSFDKRFVNKLRSVGERATRLMYDPSRLP